MQVAISELLRIKQRFDEINSVPLEQIEFVDAEGNIVDIPEKHRREFAFIGLNNTDFILTDFYKTGWSKE